MVFQTPPAEFAKLLMELGSSAQERTLEEIFRALEIPEEVPVLIKLNTATRALERCGIEAVPPLPDGSANQYYLLRAREDPAQKNADILDAIPQLESSSQEFKTTYWCDFDRKTHNPNSSINDLKSDEVKNSALKAIAGFLSTGGGRLIIGIDDNGNVIGLESDLLLFPRGRQTIDFLTNQIKNDIADRFYEGDSVNDYLIFRAIDTQDKTILTIDVSGRKKLSFLKIHGNDYWAYRRQENRTVKIENIAMEEFIEWRKEKGYH